MENLLVLCQRSTGASKLNPALLSAVDRLSKQHSHFRDARHPTTHRHEMEGAGATIAIRVVLAVLRCYHSFRKDGGMNIDTIIAELKAERDRINRALAAIEGLNSTGRRRGRPPGSTNAPKKRGRRKLSAAARRKLSRLLKQRWAQGKMKRKKAV
jgi:hypothetical protein